MPSNGRSNRPYVNSGELQRLPTPQPPSADFSRIASPTTLAVVKALGVDARRAEGLIDEIAHSPEAQRAFAADNVAYHQWLAQTAAAAGSPTVVPEPEPEPDQADDEPDGVRGG